MHKTSVSLRTTAKPVGRPPHRRRKVPPQFERRYAVWGFAGFILDLWYKQGDDTFVFLANSNSGQDVITDFQAGSDKVVFADVVSADKLSNAVWDDASHILSFSGVGKDGHTYNNSVTFNGLSSGETLDSVLQKHVEFLG